MHGNNFTAYQRLALSGSLIALEVVLSRFLSVSAWNLKLGFGFVPVVLAALLLGPLAAAAVGGIADLLGALLFPIGAYFPGFTLSAFLTGLVFGWLLHKKISPSRTALAVLLTQLFMSLGLNTVWISLLYGTPIPALLASRLFQCAVMVPVEIITILAITAALKRYTRARVR